MVNLELVNASTGKRAGAKLIDLGLAWILQLLPYLLALASLSTLSGSAYPTSSDEQALLAAAVWWVTGTVLGIALWIFCWAWEARTGKTPGQAMLGLRTSGPEGLAPGWGAVFVRNFVFGLICLIPVAGVVLALISNMFDPNSKRQGWHDKAARTFVFDVRAGRDPLTTGGINGPASFAPRADLPSVQEVASPMASPAAKPQVPARPATAPAAPPAGAVPPAAAPAPAGAVPAPAPAPHAADPDADLGATRFAPSRQTGAPAAGGAPSASDVVLTFNDGRRIALRGPVLIGRNPAGYDDETVQEFLAVDDPGKSVSKTHLAVWSDPSGVWVQDRKSTNGTRVVRADGATAEAPAGQPVLVDAGDVVRFGDCFFSIGRGHA
ncbi:hypothetical protein SAT01_21090 [Sinomonas atrocyanea]|nr:RDD family protein [Sinomonas atrocyanea]GEB64661.1 hypothetical protein SAT01_21090 [Sinomonas atrocyanea]